MAAESSSETPTQSGDDARVSQPQVDDRPWSVDQAQPIRSEDLLRGGREVHILHAGELYRLSLTRSGKLILHK